MDYSNRVSLGKDVWKDVWSISAFKGVRKACLRASWLAALHGGGGLQDVGIVDKLIALPGREASGRDADADLAGHPHPATAHHPNPNTCEVVRLIDCGKTSS